jgi:hypothetical protein
VLRLQAMASAARGVRSCHSQQLLAFGSVKIGVVAGLQPPTVACVWPAERNVVSMLIQTPILVCAQPVNNDSYDLRSRSLPSNN